jgi:hypothetical protein
MRYSSFEAGLLCLADYSIECAKRYPNALSMGQRRPLSSGLQKLIFRRINCERPDFARLTLNESSPNVPEIFYILIGGVL